MTKIFVLSYICSCLEMGPPLKPEIHLNNIYKFSPYLTGNTLHLRYKAQPVNAVSGNSRCLVWKSCGTYKYTVWAEWSYFSFKHVVHIVTAVLYSLFI
jgi:hypothetical protein